MLRDKYFDSGHLVGSASQPFCTYLDRFRTHEAVVLSRGKAGPEKPPHLDRALPLV